MQAWQDANDALELPQARAAQTLEQPGTPQLFFLK